MANGSTKFTNFVDRVNSEIASWTSLLVPVSVIIVILDVGVRYLIPKYVLIWPFDLSWMVFAFYFMLAAPYTLFTKGHVRIDFLLGHTSDRTQSLIDFFYYLIFFVPIMVVLIIYGIPYAAESVAHGERWPGAWLPPVYHVKILIPVASFLFLAQVISEMIKCVKNFKKSTTPPQAVDV